MLGENSAPIVHVVMATYNGEPWISAQVQSILNQRGVRVHLAITDDGSTDGTVERVRHLTETDDRVELLPARIGKRGAGQNFLSGLSQIEINDGEYLAFADQDDLWHPNKLAHQIEFLNAHKAQATSSNVLSFDESGKTRLIRKDQPQRRWDFIFEAPGPGSTFVLTSTATQLVQSYLETNPSEDIWLHDWFIYALVRAAGLKWVIDSRPHVAYRQHRDNALGEHRGIAAVQQRLGNMRDGTYRQQFILTAEAALTIGSAASRDPAWIAELGELLTALQDTSPRGRCRLLRFEPQMRRDPLEGVALSAAMVLHLW